MPFNQTFSIPTPPLFNRFSVTLTLTKAVAAHAGGERRLVVHAVLDGLVGRHVLGDQRGVHAGHPAD